MLPPLPPADPSAQLAWLVDRAAICDVILAFQRAIDEKDRDTYADCFAEDGKVVLPHMTTEGREAIRNMRHPPAHWRTQHISSNHQIAVNGDTATARAYLQAAHQFEPGDLAKNARAGGWYDIALVRTAEGWRFASVGLTIVWNTGEMIRPAPPVPADG